MATALPLTNKIHRKIPESLEISDISASFGDGYSQTAPDGIHPVIEVYEILWAPVTKTERQTIIDFIKSVGTWGQISWTPPDDSAVKYFRIKRGTKIGLRRLSNTHHEITITLEQVFDI
jgi:phage-related protein